MEHTQGPWYKRSQGSEIEIKSGLYTICMVHDYNEPHETNEANAKLIAAAPDLLEALRFCQSVIKSQGMFDLSERMAFDKAEEALKKATL